MPAEPCRVRIYRQQTIRYWSGKEIACLWGKGGATSSAIRGRVRGRSNTKKPSRHTTQNQPPPQTTNKKTPTPPKKEKKQKTNTPKKNPKPPTPPPPPSKHAASKQTKKEKKNNNTTPTQQKTRPNTPPKHNHPPRLEKAEPKNLTNPQSQRQNPPPKIPISKSQGEYFNLSMELQNFPLRIWRLFELVKAFRRLSLGGRARLSIPRG